MKLKVTKKPKTKLKEGRLKPISFYPLKPEEVLAAFMKVNPKKVVSRKQK